MNSVIIRKEIQAWQWNGEEQGLPEGFYLCRPEVHYSADRKLVYFTYADLPSHHWISAAPLSEQPETPFGGTVLLVTRKDGTTYYRAVYPFACWSVKSEASFKSDWKARFLDIGNREEFEAFLDYGHGERWFTATEASHVSLPPRVEYREVDGACGRGYCPHYLKPGDWLLRDGPEYRVVSAEEFDRDRC
jgi:hypothetical protein